MLTDRNTNRPGYKKTKVGWIPEEWNIARLDQLACISTGDKDTQDRQIDGKYPFFVRSETIERINSYSYDGVAVLTAGDGVGTGKVFHYIDGKFDFHQRVYKVSDFSTRLNSRYFFNYFRHNFLTQVTRYTAKNSVDSIRREMIAGMPIPLPPLPEQKKIAEILSTWDEGIEQNRALIATAKCRKKALMQKLLMGKKRLPGFKDPWISTTLRDLATVHYGRDWKAVADKNGNVPVFGTGGIIGYASHTLEQGPAIVIGRKGSIDQPQFIRGAFWAVDTTFFLKPIVEFEIGWLYAVLCHRGLARYSEASGVPSLSRTTIENLHFMTPSYAEQRAIAAVLAAADKEIAALESKLAAMEKQKRGLMQKLLTGQVRVKPPRGEQHA